MRLEEIAALGTCRGAGESLASWLRAGPLGSRALSYFPELRNVKIDSEDEVASCTICPSCSTSKRDHRRLYARSEWNDPRVVVCIEHARPLQHIRPALLSTTPPRKHPVPEFRNFANWIRRWQAQSPCSSARRLTVSESCLEDVLLDAVTRDKTAAAASTWQWRLWMAGWPLSPSARSKPQFQLADMRWLPDRLALVGTIWRLCQLLRGETLLPWPPVRLAEEVYASLEDTIWRCWPSVVARWAEVFRPDRR